MLDTLNISYGGFVDYGTIGKILTNCKGGQKHQHWVKGNLKNLSIYATPRKLTIMGSIAKYYIGDNITGLPIEKVSEGIQELSEILDYNLFEAIVNRVDVGTCLKLKNNPDVYRSLLTHKPNYYKNEHKNSTYFHTDTNYKVLAFYTKCRTNNLLKYEYRLTTNGTIKQTLKLNHKPTVLDIIENNNLLLQHYKSAYSTLRKSQTVSMNKAPKGIKDLNNYALALLMNDPKQREIVKNAISQNADKKQRYEMNKKLRSAEQYKFSYPNELITELDNKVREAYKKHLVQVLFN